MRDNYLLVLFVIIVIPFARLGAQEIDNTAPYRNINSDSYIRLVGDDDYLKGTDDQYTEGVSVEICMPWIKKFPLSRLLVHPGFSDIRYGLGVEHAGYTPANLEYPYFPWYDRPYAATLFLKISLIATDIKRKQRFATVLSLGIIGSAAQGDNLQRAAHIILHDVVPPGWKYQVKNDLIANYQLNYQKQLLSYEPFVSLDIEGMARAGTLSDKAGVGLNLLLGYFVSPFSQTEMSLKKIHVYAYYH